MEIFGENGSPVNRVLTNRGFTLIEIMAVVLIMGLLMGIIGVSITGQIDKANVATARAQIAQLESALEFYR
ncbi:MAG: prepilin-type N-terminal cleavage/methylation domain-containing protein, partial [Myxococcota bacterium]